MTKFISLQCYKITTQSVLYTNSREFVLIMNTELFDKIYLSITDKIYRLAIVMLGDSNEAQDVVQDLYENLRNKGASLNISKNIEASILRSGKNFCIDRFIVLQAHSVNKNRNSVRTEKSHQIVLQ